MQKTKHHKNFYTDFAEALICLCCEKEIRKYLNTIEQLLPFGRGKAHYHSKIKALSMCRPCTREVFRITHVDKIAMGRNHKVNLDH